MLTLTKKISIILSFILLSVCLFSSNSFAIVQPSYEFYVNDTANILSSDTENYIIDINKKLYQKTGAQIVVVTVKDLEGKSIEDYSVELIIDK